MDCKIKQHVCIKFCVKLHKSTIKTLEVHYVVFGEHLDIFVSRLVEWQLKMANFRGDQAPAKGWKMLKKF
jgi:hypothetical protein